MAFFVCLEQLPARPLIDFFIRFRSDVWPGQGDGRRLFRHAVPGCFPDLKGLLWLVLCAWNNCLPDPLARAEGRQEAVSSRRARVFSGFEGCLVACFVCLEQLPARPLIFHSVQE